MDTQDYLWLVGTEKGDFIVSVCGKWDQAVAEAKLREAFKLINLAIVKLIPRKRMSGPQERQCHIVEMADKPYGYELYAGRGLWAAVGSLALFEAELVGGKHEAKEAN